MKEIEPTQEERFGAIKFLTETGQRLVEVAWSLSVREKQSKKRLSYAPQPERWG